MVHDARHSTLALWQHCMNAAHLLPCCSWSARPWGCEHEKGWSLQWDHFSLLAQHHTQAESELAQSMLGSNPTIRSIPVHVTFMPQKRASKLEFGILRQTENFPFHQSNPSTNTIYLYPISIYFCWIWLAVNARVLDWVAVKINWHFSYCCLAQASILTVENSWTQLKSQVLQKDHWWLLHHPPPLLYVFPLQCNTLHYKVSKKCLLKWKVQKHFATHAIMSHFVKQHMVKLFPHVNNSRLRE